MSCAADLQYTIEAINEKWELSYPLLNYYPILKTPVEVTPITDFVGGVANETQFDDMWGEDIVPTAEGNWVQPHEESIEGLIADAVNTRVYAVGVPLHLAVQKEPTDYTLKKYGFDEQTEFLVTVPAYALDLANVTCQVGDYFEWGSSKIEVAVVKRSGYFYNTNLALYLILGCRYLRLGS